MLAHAARELHALGVVGGMDVAQGDVCRVGLGDCELVAAQADLHGVAHGCELDHGDLGARREAHVEDVLAEVLVVAIDRGDYGVLADLQAVQLHWCVPLGSLAFDWANSSTLWGRGTKPSARLCHRSVSHFCDIAYLMLK